MKTKLEEKTIEPFKTGRKTPPTKLEYLEEGRRFEICGLEEYFRNLYIYKIMSGSILIRGEKKNDENEWTPLGIGYYVASSTLACGL